ncbi:hypothetical protein KAS24_02965 [Candidatus Bathyarchaeota archaeon]|nr:hypothetical protein [Candidatus Bathyarchaeota archaeon]
MLLRKTKLCVDQFKLERIPAMENIQNELNDLGNDGWELVSVQNIRLDDGGLFTVAYLKRKKP